MGDSLKILIVDDEKVIRDLFEFTLGYSGHAVTLADTAEKALECIRTEDFDIVFIDIVMPEKDGVELLKEIKALHPQLPVVMMSGYSITDKRKEALNEGAVTCLNKPFEVEDIKRIIKETIGKDT